MSETKPTAKAREEPTLDPMGEYDPAPLIKIIGNQEKLINGRFPGHSKLVYDKKTRSIVAIDPHPKEPTKEDMKDWLREWRTYYHEDTIEKIDDIERQVYAAILTLISRADDVDRLVEAAKEFVLDHSTAKGIRLCNVLVPFSEGKKDDAPNFPTSHKYIRSRPR